MFVTFYGLTLLTIRLLGAALDAYARRENLYTTGAADDELLADRRTLLPVVTAYAVVILVGLALPTAAVVLYLAVSVFLVVPFHEIPHGRGRGIGGAGRVGAAPCVGPDPGVRADPHRAHCTSPTPE